MTHTERLRALARVMALLADIAAGEVGLTLLSTTRDGLGTERQYQSEDGSTRLLVYASDATGWNDLLRVELPDGPILTDRDLGRPLGWYIPSRTEQVAFWGIAA